MDDAEKHQCKIVIDEKLVRTGEKDKLKEYLRLRLVESGWRDKLKAHCKEVVKAKGTSNASIDELIKEITPQARGKPTLVNSVQSNLAKSFISIS
ncbi:hypothetical protein MT418_006469 [Batrachochytrium dendrobatidis]